MEQKNGLRVFISYSHEDNHDDSPYIDELIKHMAMLKDNGLISDIWYDRKNLAGENFQSGIDNNLEKADIICLLISANYFFSANCKDEKKKAIELWKKGKARVIPIILSACEWKDDKDISENHIIALPTDGKPVSNFSDRNTAWLDVSEGIKKVILKEIKIKQLKLKEEFENFLQDVEMLAEAHPHKEKVLLDNIFIYPDLDKYDILKKDREVMNSKEFFNNILNYSRIVIVGEEQSGKTTLCKMVFKELRVKNFIPIYVSGIKNTYAGKIETKLKESLSAQYNILDIDEVFENFRDRIVPILDDFHLAKNKEKYIKDLSPYFINVLAVDDIFSLNISDEKLLSSFNYFKIKELKPTLRDNLIKKWLSLSDRTIRDDYKDIDLSTEQINSILGKTLGNGIMSAYPFFILSTIVTYETTYIPLSQEITSQGFCYQAFIYFYLKKQGVKNEDDIGTHLNFLTELAFYIYKSKKYELSPDEFKLFIDLYSEKFNLTIGIEVLLRNLNLIILCNSFNNYLFRYKYVYYFFVAKYLAEHLRDKEIEDEIEKIIHNLYLDENAYIAVFIAHHSSDVKILDKIESNSSILFESYECATLTKDEVGFFDKQMDIIVKAALPPPDTTPEKERKEILKVQDELEESRKEAARAEDINKEDSLARDLRKAIKTGEVMGQIIKNRAGSLEKIKLEELFKLAMSIYLRILSSIFNVIRDEDNQNSIIEYLSKAIKKFIEEREKNNKHLSEDKIKEFAEIVFWNFVFFTTSGIILMIVRSLGSDRLTQISNKVCNEVNTPASFLVKQGILMWYSKNPQITEIARKIKEPEFSKFAERTIKIIITSYCRLHPISYKDRQRIEAELKIHTEQFLLADNENQR